MDTTSFSVTGEYEADLDAHTLAVTYGYSRDHRADLKQWMLALATTRTGDVPLFCQVLDGNASDKLTLVAAGDVRTLCIGRKQFEGILRERPETSLAVMRVLCARLKEAQETRAVAPGPMNQDR